MTNILLQKNYLNGNEFIYDCSIDDEDMIHFTNGTSNGMTSDPDIPIIDNITGELIISFPSFKDIIGLIDYITHYDDGSFYYEISDADNKMKIETYTFNDEHLKDRLIRELIISEKFLKESFEILEKIWIDD